MKRLFAFPLGLSLFLLLFIFTNNTTGVSAPQNRMVTAQAVYTVNPSGDTTGQTDGDNIQAMIDAANPGDKIVLGAGTFYLGKYQEVDTSLVFTKRGSFFYFTDFPWGTGDVRSPDINPDYYAVGGGPDTPPFPQAIIVDKPVTITGENSADSLNPTIITTVNNWSENPYSFIGFLYADANSFIVSSSNVTISNLKFYDTYYGIRIISAGTVVEDCIFDTCGHYSLLYFMDDYAPYPNYPSYKKPVASILRGNKWLNAIQAMHMYGSEIIATDNFFEIRNDITPEIPYSLWAIVLGGITEYTYIPGIFTQTICRNNFIENNIVEGDEKSWYGAFFFGGYGRPIVENQIVNNTVRNMFALLESYGSSTPVNDNIIAKNRVEGGVVFAPVSYGILLDGMNFVPRDNSFQGNTYVDVTYPMIFYEGRSNTLLNNDFTQTNKPGWPSGSGCIFLGPATLDNFVVESHFPKGTTLCEQILNLGDNFIPGQERCIFNPNLAPQLQNVQEKKGMKHIR